MSHPRFSVVTTTRDEPVDVVRDTLQSLRRQSLAGWEWCIAYDASTDAAVIACLREHEAADPRIRVLTCPSPAGSPLAWLDACVASHGEFLAFLAAGDVLVDDALSVMNHWLTAHAPVDVAYSDEARLGPGGAAGAALGKPGWSPERLRGEMYIGRLLVVRRALALEVGAFGADAGGAWEHDLALRVTERTDRVVHVPEVLYHRRDEGRPSDVDVEAGRRAVQEHCDRRHIPAEVEGLPHPGTYRVRRHYAGTPQVSVVVAADVSDASTGDGPDVPALRAVTSMLERSTYPSLEAVVVADRSVSAATVARISGIDAAHLRVVPVDRPVDGLPVNVGASAARGQLLVLLDGVVDIVTPDWIETLLGLAVEPDCGVAEATVLGADGHDLALRGSDVVVDHECPVVGTGAVMVRREVWEEIGGSSDERTDEPLAVDLVGKVRHRGYRVVCTPHAVVRMLPGG